MQRTPQRGGLHVTGEAAMCRSLVFLPPLEQCLEVVCEAHTLEIFGDCTADFDRRREHAPRRRCVIACPERFFEIGDRKGSLYSEGLGRRPCGVGGFRLYGRGSEDERGVCSSKQGKSTPALFPFFVAHDLDPSWLNHPRP